MKQCKRPCFALQKVIFYAAKGNLLESERQPFGKCILILNRTNHKKRVIQI